MASLPVAVDETSNSQNHEMKTEGPMKKLPYPISVFFILTTEFCERFSFYGLGAILSIYLRNVLGFEEHFATTVYHVFTMFCYFTPLLGAVLADSFLGKFRTIFYLSIGYAVGNILISLGATPPLSLPTVPFTMVGLGLVALGTGGIKPCVASFGGDQFVLPDQEKQLASYFSVFYIAINTGSLFSTILTPILRRDVSCFDEETCYSLAFFVPAALMLTGLIVFVTGKSVYTVRKLQGNIVLKVLRCIWHGASEKMKNQNTREREHWLDHADTRFDSRFIEDVKIVLRVLLLYVPLPVFWALFFQQGSRWTFQATRMDGKTFGYVIKPDQVQVFSSALILIMIPIFDKGVYPLLAKADVLKKPLQKLVTGGIFAGLAFVAAGVLELEVQKTYPIHLESGYGSLHVLNTIPCTVEFKFGDEQREIFGYDAVVFKSIEAAQYDTRISLVSNSMECQNAFNPELNKIVEVHSGNSDTVLIGVNEGGIEIFQPKEPNDVEISDEGNSKIRFLAFEFEVFRTIPGSHSVYIEFKSEKEAYTFQMFQSNETTREAGSGWYTKTEEIEPNIYDVMIYSAVSEGNPSLFILNSTTTEELKIGGSYLFTLNADHMNSSDSSCTAEYHLDTHIITPPNSVKILWILPQNILLTAGEIMFAITGLEFSYSQAPVSMKSVMQSAWLMAVAFGNLIVVIIAESKLFKEQWKEFFLFAGLMFLDMSVFSYLAWRYVPAKFGEPSTPTKLMNEESN